MTPSGPRESSYQRRLTPSENISKDEQLQQTTRGYLRATMRNTFLSSEFSPFTRPPILLPQQLLHEYWDSGTYSR